MIFDPGGSICIELVLVRACEASMAQLKSLKNKNIPLARYMGNDEGSNPGGVYPELCDDNSLGSY